MLITYFHRYGVRLEVFYRYSFSKKKNETGAVPLCLCILVPQCIGVICFRFRLLSITVFCLQFPELGPRRDVLAQGWFLLRGLGQALPPSLERGSPSTISRIVVVEIGPLLRILLLLVLFKVGPLFGVFLVEVWTFLGIGTITAIVVLIKIWPPAVGGVFVKIGPTTAWDLIILVIFWTGAHAGRRRRWFVLVKLWPGCLHRICGGLWSLSCLEPVCPDESRWRGSATTGAETGPIWFSWVKARSAW